MQAINITITLKISKNTNRYYILREIINDELKKETQRFFVNEKITTKERVSIKYKSFIVEDIHKWQEMYMVEIISI